MTSLLVKTVRRTCAQGVRRISAIAIGACVVVCANGSAFAQTNGKIPEFTSNPSVWAWVRIRADGRNALYGDGWLDPPAGMRGPASHARDRQL